MSGEITAAIIAASGALLAVAISHFFAEAAKRHAEAQSIAGGLAGELRAFAAYSNEAVGAMQRSAEYAEGGGRYEYPSYQVMKSLVYEANVGRIGLLGPEVAESVAFIYSRIQSFRNLQLMGSSARDLGVRADAFNNAAKELLRVSSLIPEAVEKLHRIAARSFLDTLAP